ncbi:MAG: 4Fe-4S dicluster domain-containing protein [Burkholderiaceae bacterium]|nr:4Fe-4S dicluster domain-containing protein [Burkholderiaceae bacterium]
MISPPFFESLLYAALALSVLGLAWRISKWLRIGIGPDARAVAPSRRVRAALRGAAAVLFTRRVLPVLAAFLVDTLFLPRLLAQQKLRWLAHLLVAAGFTLLVLMHALAPLVTAKLFAAYEPTLDPYLFLRNLSGAMVLLGTALLVIGRRTARTGPGHARRWQDAAFVALLGLVLVTGFLLEAHKIASPLAFQRMTSEYLGARDEAQLKPLRALWASEFGVSFGGTEGTPDPAIVEQGRKLHAAACAACHDRPRSAFVSYPLARLLAPLTSLLDQLHAAAWLSSLHVLACLLGLASLPFTGFFHALAAPLSLLANAVARARARSVGAISPAARATRRAMAADACVRCGLCDAHCSVAPLARYIGNAGLLPSYKLVATAALADGRLLRSGGSDGPGDEALRAADGANLCTDCGRCTQRCPVGLDLADLWGGGRADLAAAGLPAPARWVQAKPALAWAQALEPGGAQHSFSAPDGVRAPLAADRHSFSRCVQCQTCTNVCPVVAQSMAAGSAIDLTPQKVMNLLRLGLHELTLGSQMVWSCATCYQCQELCPEGLRVTDIICELRALAVQRLGAVRTTVGTP